MTWKPIRKIILVDDNQKELEGLIDLAEQKRIDVSYFQNWEEAKAELIDNFDAYHAIILDGKGQLNSDSPKEDDEHIHEALGWLREEKGKGNHIHYVLFTGYHQDFKSLSRQITIYRKNQGKEKQMLEDILRETSNLAKVKFPDVFGVFQESFFSSSKTKQEYTKLATSIIKHEFEDKVILAVSIRRIQESIYKLLKDKKILPADCFQSNGGLNFKKAKYFLSGSQEYRGKSENIQGQSIENLSSMIYWVSSANLHYKKQDEEIYKISKNTVLSMFYALNEQLLWCKQVIQNF